MSFNTITVVGNLGRDPELRYTPQGDAVCSFTIATNDKKKDASGQYQEIVHWFKITLWGKRAEAAAKYLQKGKPVYIRGRLGVEEWTDRENQNRYSLTVNADDMQFIGGTNNSDGRSEYDQSRPAGGYDQRPANDFPTHTGGGPANPAPANAAPTNAAPTTAPIGLGSGPVAPVLPDDDIPF